MSHSEWPPKSRPKTLRYPIDDYKRDILYLLERHRVLIVVGETGSGKSTRIPQILFEAGVYNKSNAEQSDDKQVYKNKLICITQPRRVAAIELARRNAEELGCQLGSTVGYVVRFTDATCRDQTMIKYVTVGILLRELLVDPLLNQYSVIIIDEVHERNLDTDLMIGFLKCILLKNTDLKLIISSASINVEEFVQYFTYPDKLIDETSNLKRPAVIYAQGKTYPVNVYYRNEPVANYMDSSVETVINIHETIRLESGKILIFLTGYDEVEYVCDRLIDYSKTLSSRLDVKQLLVLPLHASLSPSETSKVFDEYKRDTRVCIVSTNVAETSLTINGIAFVIDCGFEKLKIFNQRTGMDSLIRVPISKASAKQRAGRAGRTRDGIVYRLYPEAQYKELDDSTRPEIQRSSLVETLMLLKSIGIDDIRNFSLLSTMPKENLIAAIEILYALQVIDDSGNLTSIGQLMAPFNMDPRITKILISPESAGCTQEACKVAAMLQVKEIYSKPSGSASSLWSSQHLSSVCAVEGDLISYINIINGFITSQKSKRWAEKRFLNYQALLSATEILTKIEAKLKRSGISITSASGRTELIQRSILSGLFSNAAYLHPSGCYKTIRGEQTVYVHPTSVFSEMIEQPQYVVFVEILNTTKPYMRHLMTIERNWLLDVAPHFYTFATDLEMMRQPT